MLDDGGVAVQNLVHQVRLHHDAAVADRLRDQRHLQRRYLEIFLTDCHPGHLDLVHVGPGCGEGAIHIAATGIHLTGRQVDWRFLIKTKFLLIFLELLLAQLQANPGKDGVNRFGKSLRKRIIAGEIFPIVDDVAIYVKRPVPVINFFIRRKSAGLQRRRRGDQLEG